jgi:hypothetical protein
MNIISASSPRCLLVALPHVERAPPPAAFDFDLARDFDLEAQTKRFPVLTLIPISTFSHCSDHPVFARVWDGHSCPSPLTLILFLLLFFEPPSHPQFRSCFRSETQTAQTERPAPLVFTLYIQNIKLQGVNGTC